MLTRNINLRISKNKKNNKKIKKLFYSVVEEKNEILKSLDKNYRDKFQKNQIRKYKKFPVIQLIGMGGSILGSKSIYSFLRHKIKKKFIFRDNLLLENKNDVEKKKLNLIISKSGNTLETICNSNILIKKDDKNLFITENKKSYLSDLAIKLKSEIIHHNNFIGGRYSVLSEVGMLPAALMGLNVKKFRRFNNLVKNKKFVNSLIMNVSNTFQLIKKKKLNSVILNYDYDSTDLLYWYQQLLAESLGKKNKGLFPIISNMPKDNHSLMQHYLDGTKNNMYTFFFVHENLPKKIKNNLLFKNQNFLKNKKITDIKYAQYFATMKVFEDKNISYRSFQIKNKNEEALGELFTFFILETILLGKLMKINPYDQPSVELIKNKTKEILVNNF